MSFRAACALALLALPSVAGARSVAGVDVAEQFALGPQALVLNGAALFEATILRIDVYVAALYLPERTADSLAVERCDQPWNLRLRFLRDIGGGRYRDGWRDKLEERAGAELPAYQRAIDRLVDAFGAVAEGEVQDFTWRPGVGLELSVGGQRRTVVPGRDFCRLFIRGFVDAADAPGGLDRGLMGH